MDRINLRKIKVAQLSPNSIYFLYLYCNGGIYTSLTSLHGTAWYTKQRCVISNHFDYIKGKPNHSVSHTIKNHPLICGISKKLN